ncbi:polysaccharide biosynthesis tyrosine autokinase [Enteractinococcus coprophilus]|nr:polysaccharide biosynthesis tyrosine autokinase [Enteractinococcus coprophilus]
MQTSQPPQRDVHVNVRNYGHMLIKHWVTIVLGTVLGLVLGLLASTQLVPKYTATTTLYISVRATGGGATDDLLQGANFAQAAMPSYADVVKTTLVLDQVSEELDGSILQAELSRALTVSSPPESVLLKITAAHDDAQTAARIANTTGAVFIQVVENELETSNSGQHSPVQARTVDLASVPEPHTGSHYIRNGTIGVFMGTLLGIGLVVVRDLLDTRVHTANDLENVTSLPVLGRIPHDDKIHQHPLIVHDEPSSARAEALRMLRTNLQFLGSGGPETYLLTSAVPGEGKTHTVANLSIVLAESGARVTLVDADLRRPRVAEVMGIEGTAGLSDVLIDQVSLTDVLQPWGLHELTVLPAGQIPPNPSELLGSPVMRNLIRELEAISDYVLIDTPPVLPVTDAAVASTFTSGVIMVVSLNHTKWSEIIQALESLETVDSRLLGFITNRETSATPGASRRSARASYGMLDTFSNARARR